MSWFILVDLTHPTIEAKRAQIKARINKRGYRAYINVPRTKAIIQIKPSYGNISQYADLRDHPAVLQYTQDRKAVSNYVVARPMEWNPDEAPISG